MIRKTPGSAPVYDSMVSNLWLTKESAPQYEPTEKIVPKHHKCAKLTYDIFLNKCKQMRKVSFCTYFRICRIFILLYFINHEQTKNIHVKKGALVIS